LALEIVLMHMKSYWLRLAPKAWPAIVMSLPLVCASALNNGHAADLAGFFPRTGVLLGVYAEPMTNTAEQAILKLEQEIGRRFCVDHQYYQWQDGIPTAYETWTASQGGNPKTPTTSLPSGGVSSTMVIGTGGLPIGPTPSGNSGNSR
jgi:hypothetical protein